MFNHSFFFFISSSVLLHVHASLFSSLNFLAAVQSALEDGGIPLAALWESVLLLLVSLLRDMEPGSYVLQHRPGASHVDVLVPAPPTERRPPPQSPALVSAPPMPLVHHLPSLTEQVAFREGPKGKRNK